MPEVSLPTVTVITVCLNASSVIKKTIESVLDQTYVNIEYIIIDGNSSDNTAAIINSYGTQIKYFISEPDTGLYDAMNKGIELASGELIIFLNAGDHFVCSYSLSAFISKVIINEADVFFGRIVWVDVIHNHVIASDHTHINYDFQLVGDNFPHPATFYTRNAFNKFGVFNLAYPILADYEWNLRTLIREKAKFKYVDSFVSTFYTGGISTSEKFDIEKSREKILLMKHYFDYYTKLNQIKNVYLKKLLLKIYSFKLFKVY